MSSAKEKREKRKEALRNRRQAENEIQDALANEPEVNIEYVLPPPTDEVNQKIEELALRRSEISTEEDAPAEEEKVAKKNTAEAPKGESNNTKRKRHRFTPEELSAAVGPKLSQLVEFHDCDARDPIFTVLVKGVRNTVPVPRHWESKSRFLKRQTDRESGDYVVPGFIRETGVAAIRLNPEKASKVFAEALQLAFKFPNPDDANKTKLTRLGDVFHEGKDTRSLRYDFVPGAMSARLKKALGMKEDSSVPQPPPWLIAFQQMGRLPPSYPNSKIPGLNAPLPEGAQWGMSVGQWGEPARHPNGTLIFPEVVVKSKKAKDGDSARITSLWGYLPPRTAETIKEQAQQRQERAQAAAAQHALRPPPPVPGAPHVPLPAHFVAAATAGNLQPGFGFVPPPQTAWAMEYVRRPVQPQPGDPSLSTTGGFMAPEYRYQPKSQ